MKFALLLALVPASMALFSHPLAPRALGRAAAPASTPRGAFAPLRDGPPQMSKEQMEAAMKQMQSMSADDMKRMMGEISNMSPDQKKQLEKSGVNPGMLEMAAKAAASNPGVRLFVVRRYASGSRRRSTSDDRAGSPPSSDRRGTLA
jgi:hypothetical protein